MVHFCGLYFHCPLRKYCRRAARKIMGKPAPIAKGRVAASKEIPGISEDIFIDYGTTRTKVTLPRSSVPFSLLY